MGWFKNVNTEFEYLVINLSVCSNLLTNKTTQSVVYSDNISIMKMNYNSKRGFYETKK